MVGGKLYGKAVERSACGMMVSCFYWEVLDWVGVFDCVRVFSHGVEVCGFFCKVP